MAGYDEDIYEDELVDFPETPARPPRQWPGEQQPEKLTNAAVVTQSQPNQPPQVMSRPTSKNKRLKVVLVIVAVIVLCAAVVMSAYALAKYTQTDETSGDREMVRAIDSNNGTCDQNSCKNNGKCVTIIQGGYYCLCNYERYYGRHCENDTDRRFPVYCDQDTDGGGWTLVWRYGFTNYDFFGDITNAVTPVPFWNVVSAIHLVSDVETSSTPPLGETERGAVDFSFWKKIGSEFMVKSNINNWIKCIPAGGSLVEMKNGAIKCEVLKSIKNCTTVPNPIPPVLVVIANQYSGPLLCTHTINNGNHYYYYWVGSTTKLFPIHDPCGRSGQNQKENVADPYGAVYLR